MYVPGSVRRLEFDGPYHYCGSRTFEIRSFMTTGEGEDVLVIEAGNFEDIMPVGHPPKIPLNQIR